MNREISNLLVRLSKLLPQADIDREAQESLPQPYSDSMPADAKANNSAATEQNAPSFRGWTSSDDWLMRLAWGTVSMESLASMLDRPISQIELRAEFFRSQLQTGSWSPEEHRLLKKVYISRTNDDLEITLLRHRDDIATTANSFDLSKLTASSPKRKAANDRTRRNRKRSSEKQGSYQNTRTKQRSKMPRWTSAEVQQLIELYDNHDNESISRTIGRSVTSIANKAWQLGIGKSTEQLARIGKANVSKRHHRDASSDPDSNDGLDD